MNAKISFVAGLMIGGSAALADPLTNPNFGGAFGGALNGALLGGAATSCVPGDSACINTYMTGLGALDPSQMMAAKDPGPGKGWENPNTCAQIPCRTVALQGPPQLINGPDGDILKYPDGSETCVGGSCPKDAGKPVTPVTVAPGAGAAPATPVAMRAAGAPPPSDIMSKNDADVNDAFDLGATFAGDQGRIMEASASPAKSPTGAAEPGRQKINVDGSVAKKEADGKPGFSYVKMRQAEENGKAIGKDVEAAFKNIVPGRLADPPTPEGGKYLGKTQASANAPSDSDK